MKSHPAAELFPLMSGPEYEALVADIRANGQREPIVVHDGQILDGRNRWRACVKLGLEPVTQEWNGEGSPASYVVSLNLIRRHLDEGQRALVGARLKPLYEAEAKARQATSTGGASPQLRANLPEAARARDTAAKAVNVSPRSVESASKVLRSGAPELVEAVEQGRVAVSNAAALADAPRERQLRAVQAPEEAVGAGLVLPSHRDRRENSVSDKGGAIKKDLRDYGAHCLAEHPTVEAAMVSLIDDMGQYGWTRDNVRVHDCVHRGNGRRA